MRECPMGEGWTDGVEGVVWAVIEVFASPQAFVVVEDDGRSVFCCCEVAVPFVAGQDTAADHCCTVMNTMNLFMVLNVFGDVVA